MFRDESESKIVEVASDLRKSSRDQEPSDARITDQLGYMRAQLENTYVLISDLEARLEQVLLPPEDESSDGEVKSPPRKRSSYMSDYIDDTNGLISNMQRRLMDIQGRVQL